MRLSQTATSVLASANTFHSNMSMAGSTPAVSAAQASTTPDNVAVSARVAAGIGFAEAGPLPMEKGSTPFGHHITQPMRYDRADGLFLLEKKIMSNDEAKEIDPDFYDEDEDEYEDSHTYESIMASKPEGWSLVRVMAGWAGMVEMRDWLQENATGGYKEVNWGGECSYSVGVILEKEMDTILFKLRWG